MNKMILQERRTLDDVLVSGVKTFRNGCNYRLVKELDGKYYLECGCYGTHVNLVTGDEYLLCRWFATGNVDRQLLTGIVSKETISYLLAQKPCAVCGGAIFREVKANAK